MKLKQIIGSVVILLLVALTFPFQVVAFYATSAQLPLLILTANETDPAAEAVQKLLAQREVPFKLLNVRSLQLTQALLQTATAPLYSGVILTEGNLAYEENGSFLSAFSEAEWAILYAFEQQFQIRELVYYTFPTARYGLVPVSVVPGGTTGLFTTAGRTIFPYVNAAQGLSLPTYLYTATSLEGNTPLISDGSGNTLMSLYAPTGREALVSTFDQATFLVHTLLLWDGLLNWVTRGAFAIPAQNYFTVHIDDVFIGNTVFSDPNKEIERRMTLADFTFFAQWSRQHNFIPTMVFNGAGLIGEGSDAAGINWAKTSADKNQFEWVNHTYDHLNLDNATATATRRQIQDNIGVANNYKLPKFDPGVLVTGEHSGLQNSAAILGAANASIMYIASDASRNPNAIPGGSNTFLVPRYPANIYTDAGTRKDEQDEYNFVYGTHITYDEILQREAAIVLNHILNKDIRPHFVHQINLAQDRILIDFLNVVLMNYYALDSRPLKQLTMREIGDQMHQKKTAVPPIPAPQQIPTPQLSQPIRTFRRELFSRSRVLQRLLLLMNNR